MFIWKTHKQKLEWRITKIRDALKHSLHFKFSYSYVQILITKIIPTRNFGFCWKIFSSLKRKNQFLSIIIWNEKPEQCVAWEGGWWSIGEAGIRCHNIHLLRGRALCQLILILFTLCNDFFFKVYYSRNFIHLRCTFRHLL